MAVYLKSRGIINEHEYNASLTDSKVDFIADEVKLNTKVEVYVDAVLPVISGTEDFTLVVNDPEPDWLDGVTVTDVEDGDITDELAVDDSDVDLTTADTYELIYIVREGMDDEVSVTVDVVVAAE